jgi:hypothetical protein
MVGGVERVARDRARYEAQERPLREHRNPRNVLFADSVTLVWPTRLTPMQTPLNLSLSHPRARATPDSPHYEEACQRLFIYASFASPPSFGHLIPDALDPPRLPSFSRTDASSYSRPQDFPGLVIFITPCNFIYHPYIKYCV